VVHDDCVTAIWMEQSDGAWSLQQAATYENEQALHDMVMSTPALLPLSGSPQLTVLGREVSLPQSGYADVLAVEPDGRPVIVEVKLKNNAESRRAVIAQALSYAASLHGCSRQDLEEGILSRYLGGQSLFDRVRESLQAEDVTQSEFDSSLDAHLANGSFRVVVVLDEAPAELVNLMGYLEAVTTGLSLDLIVVTSYRIGDRRIAVPQRLDPEHRAPVAARPARSAPRTVGGHLEAGVAPFRELIAETTEVYRPTLTMMADWADTLQGNNPNLTVATYFGTAGDVSLLPRFNDQNVGLVSLWRYASGKPSISFWRSVFERRSPQYIAPLEELIGKSLGQGNTTNILSAELLDIVGTAYGSAKGAGLKPEIRPVVPDELGPSD
jgi:hypothetical protein